MGLIFASVSVPLFLYNISKEIFKNSSLWRTEGFPTVDLNSVCYTISAGTLEIILPLQFLQITISSKLKVLEY